MSKTYLGDGVYGELVDGGMIKLTTENGIDTTNVIYLEPSVYANLTRWVQNLVKASTAPPSEHHG